MARRSSGTGRAAVVILSHIKSGFRGADPDPNYLFFLFLFPQVRGGVGD
jgi:hypothetical protein